MVKFLGIDDNCIQRKVSVYCTCNGIKWIRLEKNDAIHFLVKNLSPGRNNSCYGAVVYKFGSDESFEESMPLIIPEPFPGFEILPAVSGFSVKLPQYNGLVELSIRDIMSSSPKTFNSHTYVTGLLMGTTYEICLKLLDECSANDLPEKCTIATTLEDIPSAPIKIELKTNQESPKYKLTWDAPINSGKILAYSILLNGTCPAVRVDWCNETIGTQQHHNTTKKTFELVLEPFCEYVAEVSALNSKGAGPVIASKPIKTQMKSSKISGNIAIEPTANSISVLITPNCPYEGPINYKICLRASNPQKNDCTQHEHNERNRNIEEKFTYLTPAQEYDVCISDVCKSTVTSQILPEEAPEIILIRSSESELVFDVHQPDKSYPFKNEKLVYTFKVDYTYNQSDPNCKDIIMKQSKTEQRKSSEKKFQWTLTGLKPNMKATIKTQVGNMKGNGPEKRWPNEFITFPASDTTLKNIHPEFSLTNGNNDITIDLMPVCPSQGMLTCHDNFYPLI